MNIHSVYKLLLTPFRKKRMCEFLNKLNPKSTDKILDIGGTAFNWNLIGYKYPLTLLNLSIPQNADELPKNFSCVAGDGTDLEYEDREYDIVFSNSVIEHVGSFENQKKFANEACRVGKKVWIQTPAKEFFFEPHFLTPFVHWFPKSWRKKLLRYSIWALIAKPSTDYINNVVDTTRLLSFAECKKLFPKCQIRKEKFAFMTKSYVIERI